MPTGRHRRIVLFYRLPESLLKDSSFLHAGNSTHPSRQLPSSALRVHRAQPPKIVATYGLHPISLAARKKLVNHPIPSL